MGAASTAISGTAQVKQAKAAQRTFNANARTQMRLAQDAIDRGETEVKQHAMRVRRLLADQTRARGVDPSSPFFDRIYSDTDLFSMLDEQMIIENHAREAWVHTERAKGFEIHAQAAGAQVPYIQAGMALNLAGTVARGAAEAYETIPWGGGPPEVPGPYSPSNDPWPTIGWSWDK
jgi:hypothetical protein